MTRARLALVGFGKIARDQHLPAIARTDGVELVAIASRHATLDGVANFETLDDLLSRGPEVDAVALCTPPQVRREQAALALSMDKHVLLEKPPGATVSEIEPLVAMARTNGKALFATWHSRFAPGVDPARALLAGRRIRSVAVEWREDVRIWHPGQDWIFEPGGLGVFDPGINALSIVTHVLPFSFFLTEATLAFPANRHTPIAASLAFTGADGTPVVAEFDFLQEGPQTWDIHVDTDAGRVTLSNGGARLLDDGQVLVDDKEAEYAGIYARFARLMADGACDVDLAPLIHVADAFMLGRRNVVSPFDW